MRNNQPVTQNEIHIAEGQRLISTTDLKGRITYCNQEFIAISGFTKEELIHSPHNLVRHPDVPSAIFEHMWSTLKSGQPWMGIVKNRCKNGDYYWVNAYVTPVTDTSGTVIGYESVRVKASAAQVRRAATIYARMQAGKNAIPKSNKWLPMFIKSLAFVAIGVMGFGLGNFFGTTWGLLLTIALCFPLGILGVRLQHQQFFRLLSISAEATASPLIAQMYTDSRGLVGRLEMVMIAHDAHLRTCLTRVQDSTQQLGKQASEADALAQSSYQGLERQRQETDLIATAINEMAATTQEVAGNVLRTADATEEASRLLAQGRSITAETRSAIESLSVAVGDTGKVVNQLAQDSQEIGSVVDVIKSIADQTNLLALNAAIEAARAGESGRGFAVVADEVRQLAQRTADATGQIHKLIEQLQTQARNAVETTDRGHRQAEEGVTKVLQADEALTGISQAMEQVADMSRQIASAAEEQSAVSEEVSRNITNIAVLADQTADAAQNTALLSESLSATVQQQYALVERFNR